VGTAIPAPDAIEEFKVQTANYDASYGRGAGANVDLVSKSGTNTFHGSAWEFVRNNIFNANDFFSKMDGQPRPDMKQNIFGGSFGGPIRKDRIFLFVEYQRMIDINGEALGVSISGLFTTGDAGTPSQWQKTNSFIWQDTVSLTRNRHNMSFGLEVKRHEVDVNAPFVSDGLLQINTFDDFLLGQNAALLFKALVASADRCVPVQS